MIKRVPTLNSFEWQKSVLDKDLSTPPSSPNTGDRYIVGPSATGDWAGYDNYIAEWRGSSWEFITPLEGFFTYVKDEDSLYYYNGTSWNIFSSGVNVIQDTDGDTYIDVEETSDSDTIVGKVAGELAFKVDTNKNFGIGTDQFGTNAENVLAIKTGTPPESSPSGIIQLYAEDITWDNYTKLLLHCDGADGSTTFIDEIGHSVTAYGNAQIDTSQYKFGGASALFDGSGDYLLIPDSDDWYFGDGDFTIDFWVRFNDTSGDQDIYSQFVNNVGTILIRKVNDGRLRFYASENNVPKADYYCSWNPSVGTWYHIAIVRNGSNFYMFINGVSQTLTADTAIGTSSLPNVASNLCIGAWLDGPLNVFNGWLDEIRISKGIARWTSNFTPPTEPYAPLAELKVRDEAGNITTLSPHNFKYIPEHIKEQNDIDSNGLAWTFHAEKNGKEITVDMFRAIQLLEKLTGEKLIYSNTEIKNNRSINLISEINKLKEEINILKQRNNI